MNAKNSRISHDWGMFLKTNTAGVLNKHDQTPAHEREALAVGCDAHLDQHAHHKLALVDAVPVLRQQRATTSRTSPKAAT